MPDTIRMRPWPTRAAVGSALFMVALGGTVLAGWFSHTPALIQFEFQLPPMTRNAAACSLLCGVALLIVVLRGPRWLTVVCAGIVSAISILTVVEYVGSSATRLLPSQQFRVSRRRKPIPKYYGHFTTERRILL